MTLFSDKNNNTTIVSPDASDITSSRMHYLHPEYVDEKLKSIYSQSRCPLSMLAETCKNIGKPILDNSLSQSQEPSVSISPSCSSSCSAPKFSPNSMDYSPVDQTKFTEDAFKEKLSKEKPKKRKAQKKEPEIANKRSQIDPQLLQNHYALSEFLKMNNIARDSINKPDQLNINNPIFNNLINTNNSSQFNHFPSYWKSKLSHNPRMPFSMNFVPSNYPSPNIPSQSGLYRGPPSNMLHEMNQFYNHCQIDKLPCECPACISRKHSFDKNLMKMEPILFNFFQGFRKERPFNNNSNLFLQNSSFSPDASAIKYCMYCGQCIPVIQNLLNHIHTEHIDCINTNLYSKLESTGNFSSNFNIESLQSKEINLNELNTLKNLDLIKQLQLMYNNNINNNNNNENQGNNCIDKPVLMK